MRGKIVLGFLGLTFALGALACRAESIRGENHAISEPQAHAAASATPIATSVAALAADAISDAGPHAELPPPLVEQTPVAKDSPASFVRGETPGVARIVFLPGLCSNAGAYLWAFNRAAQAHGGVVAIDGDKPCGSATSGFHSFTWDPNLQHARIERALAATSMKAPPDGFTLVGYSAGASIAEMVHEKWPELFPRLILIAPPQDLWIEKLVNAQAVVSMSCSLDVPGRMKSGAKKLGARGVRATYMEMPKCTHGNIADGEHVMGDAFAWLDTGETGEPGE
ncbi:MAG: hypothetical protein ACRELY_08775 [Polyangiaceae bacterium]